MNPVSPLAVLRLCSLAIACLLAATLAPAQTPAAASTRYLTLGYMKPEPGKTSDYVKLEREMWKLVHQDMVNQGRLISWRLYAVSWPNGEDQDYDYVTMMEYPGFAHLESAYVAADMAKALGGENKLTEMRNATGAVRQLRRTDTLTLLAATDGWSTASNRVLSVHFLRALPGKGAQLMKIQTEYFMPSNNELVKAGFATGWATTSVRYPAQLDYPYNYVSFNAYDSLTQMDKEPPSAWVNKWRAKFDESSSQLPTVRKRVKGQLWRLVDQTEPRKP